MSYKKINTVNKMLVVNLIFFSLIIHRGANQQIALVHGLVNVTELKPDLDKIRADVLRKHNELRGYHGVPPLNESAELNNMAQKYAEVLADAGGSLKHSGTKDVGENLYLQRHTVALTNFNGDDAVRMWYGEMRDYDFENPEETVRVRFNDIGHFTQVIWKKTTQIGTGFVQKEFPDYFRCYVVCNYKPAGNLVGSFKENVPRPLSEFEELAWYEAGDGRKICAKVTLTFGCILLLGLFNRIAYN